MVCKDRVLMFVAILLFYQIDAHRIDMGRCSCTCNSDRLLPGEYSNPGRGQAGAPGKIGPIGPKGLPGPKGARGEQGEGFEGTVGTAINPGLSCADLYDKGIRNDGVYFIKANHYSTTFQVYCDMTTTSAGWTLVASIHENDITAKCMPGDKWSSENWAQNSTEGGSAWSNTLTFGDLESVTSADYKNPAYSTLQSGNIMVWHVPNNTPLQFLKNRADFIYKTGNEFLSDLGGNLYSLFSSHYPLIKFPRRQGLGSTTGFIDRMVANSEAAIAEISNFHRYIYSNTETDNIPDGGSDVFDTGNQIQYSVNGGTLSSMLTYNETIHDTNGPIIETKSIHPFLFVAWLGDQNIQSFKVKVSSNLGADGSGSVTTLSRSNHNFGNGFKLTFKANEVYDASDPSCAQVFFTVTNQRLWDSSTSFSTSTPLWETSDTQNLNDEFLVSNSPRNILVGYTLLTKKAAIRITTGEIINSLVTLLGDLGQPNDLSRSSEICSNEHDTLSVPVSFLQGSGSNLVHGSPSSTRDDFEPGFVQFRALDSNGLPSAFCPGIKSNGCTPSDMCVGGINTARYGDKEKCGDFGSMDKGRTHRLQQKAIDSTRLIFYGP